jgi:hypothetical protein
MTFANLYRLFYAGIIFFCGFGSVTAQTLSPNGFSGLGVVPSAKTLPGGDAVLAFDPTMPGAPKSAICSRWRPAQVALLEIFPLP